MTVYSDDFPILEGDFNSHEWRGERVLDIMVRDKNLIWIRWTAESVSEGI
jgi:hypothetical protein